MIKVLLSSNTGVTVSVDMAPLTIMISIVLTTMILNIPMYIYSMQESTMISIPTSSQMVE